MRPKICGSVGNGRKTYAFGRMGCKILKVYRDNGLSGAKGDKRRAFDALGRDAAQRKFSDLIYGKVRGRGTERRLDRTRFDRTGSVAR
jgi:hypothetical protein